MGLRSFLVSDQSVFALKCLALNDGEGKKNQHKKPAHSRLEAIRLVVSLMVMVHPYQIDQKCKHSRMTCRACVQLPLDVDEIDASINIQRLKTLRDLLVHLADLENRRKP